MGNNRKKIIFAEFGNSFQGVMKKIKKFAAMPEIGCNATVQLARACSIESFSFAAVVLCTLFK